MLTPSTGNPLPDDVAALQALVGDLSAQLIVRDRAVTARDRIIETLKGQLAALRRRIFGQSSEKLAWAADQLELQIEDLEQQQAEQAALTAGPKLATPPVARVHPICKPLPAYLPRETKELAPP
ncbi:peptidoglycan hydrolase CwlO-like protein [Azospirillum rugosum]|uniref:Peptidoglycan hydrolase CwlO-like protein n=1 Tax=Azospirillum rugosum TaxID=416170 RepID=A0ABS4SRA7_9PROT|nr:peptidoglycan hydrolase CwlO-like protein [Azospirillum rugosum]MDQ0528468.1 peptidoglycan hydrolase CwlO-like protein [Azospirillum rugosum]